MEVNVIFLKNGIKVEDGLHFVGVCDDEHLEKQIDELQEEFGYSDEQMKVFVFVDRRELNTNWHI